MPEGEMVREGISGKHTFEQLPERTEGVRFAYLQGELF